MRIQKAGTHPSAYGKDHFTGRVRVDPVFSTESPARSKGAKVTFEPGARTYWHTHPLGQILIITQGRGYVQSWGEPRQTVVEGDCVWFPAGEKHWHGASEDTAMTHLAISEVLDGVSADWLEQVDDAQYGG